MSDLRLGIAFILAFAVSIAAQTPAPAPAASTRAKTKTPPVILKGCVDSPEAGKFTVDDAKRGRVQLTGHGLDIYIGKKVELSGDPSGGLHITTGLYPSPNVAAQAGAMDPVRAAQAALPGGAAHGTAPGPLPTFSVTKIQAIKGDCK